MHKDAAARAQAAFLHAERLQAVQDSEALQAQALLTDFVRAANELGIRPHELTARAWGRKVRYRTGAMGWYLKRDRSVGVDTAGNFLVLHAPPSLRSRVMGVKIPPSPPPLELGKGGRDGESIPLEVAIANRLSAGNDW